MNFTPLKNYGTLTESRLQEFEATIHCTLPDDYRAFLLQYNGGVPELPCVSFGDPAKDDGTIIAQFEGFPVEGPEGIERLCDDYRGRLPQAFLPIADDVGGNLLCMSLEQDDFGVIYFWLHELEGVGLGKKRSRMIRVADNFSALLSKLEPVPELPPSDNPVQQILGACRAGDIGLVHTYLLQGGDIGLFDDNYLSLVSSAAAGGHLELVKMLVERGAPISGAVRLAAVFNHYEIVNYLLDHGADINERSPVDHFTPLLAVVNNPNLPDKAPMVRLLLERGADPTRSNYDDHITRLPIVIAAEWATVEVIELLHAYGAVLDAFDGRHETAITVAAAKGNVAIVEYLLAHGVDPNIDEALHAAARTGNLDMAKLLLAHGADPNLGKEHHYTPLHAAVSTGNLDAVKLLLAHGADPLCTTLDKMTSLQLAKKRRWPQIVELLQEYEPPKKSLWPFKK